MKPLMNSLANWILMSDMRIRGQATLDQPNISVKAGEYIFTSKINNINRSITGKLIAETNNSLYILEN